MEQQRLLAVMLQLGAFVFALLLTACGGQNAPASGAAPVGTAASAPALAMATAGAPASQQPATPAATPALTSQQTASGPTSAPPSIADGERLYVQNCRACHGDAGQGRIGPSLVRPNLRDPSTRTQTQQQLTTAIACGIVGKIMPPYALRASGSLTDAQIADLVALISEGSDGDWQQVAQLSAQANQSTPEPSIAQVLAGATVTSSTSPGCDGAASQGSPTP